MNHDWAKRLEQRSGRDSYLNQGHMWVCPSGTKAKGQTFEHLHVSFHSLGYWWPFLVAVVCSECQVNDEKVHFMCSHTGYTFHFFPALMYPECWPCLKMANSGWERMLS